MKKKFSLKARAKLAKQRMEDADYAYCLFQAAARCGAVMSGYVDGVLSVDQAAKLLEIEPKDVEALRRGNRNDALQLWDEYIEDGGTP